MSYPQKIAGCTWHWQRHSLRRALAQKYASDFNIQDGSENKDLTLEVWLAGKSVLLFCSVLSCVLPLQEVALCKGSPVFSVLCCLCPFLCPCHSLLPYIVTPSTTFWSYTLWLPFLLLLVLLRVYQMETPVSSMKVAVHCRFPRLL